MHEQPEESPIPLQSVHLSVPLQDEHGSEKSLPVLESLPKGEPVAALLLPVPWQCLHFPLIARTIELVPQTVVECLSDISHMD